MPPPYTVLNARVKQKLATEAYWLSIEDELGVIFEGEQAFVYNDDGVPVNFKIGDGTKLFSELPYFIAYYSNVTNLKTLFYLAQSANITTAGVFRNNTDLQKIIFINNSGDDVLLKIGTTDGGSEIAEVSLPNGINQLDISYLFTSAVTVYFTGLTGVDFSLIALYCQLDEAPVTPPSGSGSTTPRFAYGTVYSFIPMYEGHTEASWDLITGLGKPGTDYEQAMLFGVGGLPALLGYLRSYEDGDTIGGTVGADSVTIAKTNLPAEGLGMFKTNIGNVPGDIPGTNDGVAYARSVSSQDVNYEMVKGTGSPYIGKTAPMGSGTALSTIPLSNIVLRFTGIPTTT